jgi:excinuclease ABC subunit C
MICAAPARRRAPLRHRNPPRRSSSRARSTRSPGSARRKRALLYTFGSAKDVARAGLADLEKTPGLNAATAKLVYDFFHEGQGG